MDIGSRSLDILVTLLERPGVVVDKRTLLARAWPGLVVEEANLRVHVASLRKALGDGVDGARYVTNIPGRGYCFVGSASQMVESSPPMPQVIVPAADPSASQARARMIERRSKLPPPLGRMVGRDDDVTALRSELLDHRFISIVGPGGMGKTTVAIAAAYALGDEFPHAVVFVDLAAMGESAQVAGAVAAALGLAFQIDDPVPALIEFLGAQRLLLVLDNCESVIEGAAALAERIYLGAPQAYLLATTREPLRAEGEHVYPLRPLEYPEEGRVVTAVEVLAFPAAQLFMDRARAGGARWNLTDADAVTVATICRKLDGVALALELAAGRVAAHGIRGTADLLDLRFKLFWEGRRTALPRHRTLRAMLDWSYNLLTDDERRVLRRLSVFVGTFSLEAAVAVVAEGAGGASRGAVSQTLANLVAKSLVSTHQRDSQLRFRLLEMTREFAAEKLEESNEDALIARRHAVYFSQRSADPRETIGDVDYLGNVRAALEWCFSRDDAAAIGCDLAIRVLPIFLRSSLLREGHHWSERAIAALSVAERGTVRELDLVEARAICSMFTMGNDPAVRDAIEHGLRLAQAIGDDVRQLNLLAGLNIFCTRVGDFGGALASGERSMAIARALTDPAGEAMADWMLGVAHHLLGDQRAARMHCERGMNRGAALEATQQQLFGYDHRIRALITLSRALWLGGCADEAANVARQALDEAAELGQPVSLCISFIYTTTVYLWRGDWALAQELAGRGLAESKKHSLAPYHAVLTGLLGESRLREGNATAGIRLMRGSLDALASERHVVLAPGIATALAEGYLQIGQVDEALAAIAQAIDQRSHSGAAFDMAEMLRVKARILFSRSQSSVREALALLSRAAELASANFAAAWELRIATTGLQMQPASASARQALRAVYSRFTEGLDTADLAIARQLLSVVGEPAPAVG